jgi:CII-binding regulator of phage lambda lysogenization HflD
MKILCSVAVLTVVMLLAGVASADRRDLERQIAAQEAGIRDLRALDASKAATEEIAMLATWLDETKNRLREGKQGLVRELLDRMLAQSELVRQKIAAAKLMRAVKRRRAALAELRRNIEKLKQAIQQARSRKKALEMKTK